MPRQCTASGGKTEEKTNETSESSVATTVSTKHLAKDSKETNLIGDIFPPFRDRI